MPRESKYSREVGERTVRVALDHIGAYETVCCSSPSIAEKFEYSAETLRKWVRQAEREAGRRPGLTTAEKIRLKDLERENRELRRASEILRKASA